MALSRVRLTAEAEADLGRLPFPLRRQVWQRIMRLREDPSPPDARDIEGTVGRVIQLHGCRILYDYLGAEGGAVVLAIRPAA